MVRTQIQLTQHQSQRLHEEARRAGVSVAELIRRSVDQFLSERGCGGVRASGRTSILEVVGRFDSGLDDVGARHDDYLDEAYSASTQ